MLNFTAILSNISVSISTIVQLTLTTPARPHFGQKPTNRNDIKKKQLSHSESDSLQFTKNGILQDASDRRQKLLKFMTKEIIQQQLAHSFFTDIHLDHAQGCFCCRQRTIIHFRWFLLLSLVVTWREWALCVPPKRMNYTRPMFG